jgi:hypothetical protein
MKKVRTYKDFVIAINGVEYFVFTKEEYSFGEGYRSPEFECGSVQECMDNINSY